MCTTKKYYDNVSEYNVHRKQYNEEKITCPDCGAIIKKSSYRNHKESNKNKQYYSNTVQTLLDVFGICLNRSKRIQKNGKRLFTYSLSVNEEIKNILDLKYRLVDEIDRYSNLFIKNSC